MQAFFARPTPGEATAALEEAELTALTAEGQEALLGDARGTLVITRAFSEGLRECRRSLAIFGWVSHGERIREKLLQLAREHGRVVPGGVLIGIPLTHALLAEMVGSARETVTAALRRLEAEGFVSREGRDYRLAVSPGSCDPRRCELAHMLPARNRKAL